MLQQTSKWRLTWKKTSKQIIRDAFNISILSPLERHPPKLSNLPERCNGPLIVFIWYQFKNFPPDHWLMEWFWRNVNKNPTGVMAAKWARMDQACFLSKNGPDCKIDSVKTNNSGPCTGRSDKLSGYCCLAVDTALACCRSATSMATTFSHAAYNWRRLIATLIRATGKQTMQIIVNIPNDSGPRATATQRLITAIHCKLQHQFCIY